MSSVRRAVESVPVVLYDVRRHARRQAIKASEQVGWRRNLGCRAPFASVYLHQSGDVRACCQNWWLPLGNVGEQSLLDIWRGERAETLRAAILEHDYSLGCDFCQWQHEDGDPSTIFARNFDELPLRARDPEWPAQIEFSVSNTCNLQCTMCCGEWSSSIRSQREHLPPLPKMYDERFFEDLQLFLPHLQRAKFLGGEPLLARESLRILEMLLELDEPPRVSITTNGTIWNDRVERIVSGLRPDVVVSMDGFEATTYESIRIGASFDEVVTNLDRFRAACDGIDRGVSIAFTLMRANWQALPDLFVFTADRGLEVGVNTMTDPEEQSLFTLPAAELRQVVESLEARNDEVHRANPTDADVWDGQLARLQRHLAGVEASSTSAVLLREKSRTQRRFASVALDDSTVDDRVERLVAWAPDAWARLDFDPDGLVCGGEDNGFGVGIDTVVAARGLSVGEVEQIVLPASRHMTLEWGESLFWERTFRPEPPGGELVRLLLATRRDSNGVSRAPVMWLARSLDEFAAAQAPHLDDVTESGLRDILAAWGGPEAPIHSFSLHHGALEVKASAPDPLIGDFAGLDGSPPSILLKLVEERLGCKLDTVVEAQHDGMPVVCVSTAAEAGVLVRTAIHQIDSARSVVMLVARPMAPEPAPEPA